MKVQKRIIVFSILIIILLLGIGYASFSNIKLVINPTATATASNFSVCFDSVAPEIVTKPVTAGRIIEVNAETPAENATSVNIEFNNLREVGDTAQATFVVKNKGDIAVGEFIPSLLTPGIAETTDATVYTKDRIM